MLSGIVRFGVAGPPRKWHFFEPAMISACRLATCQRIRSAGSWRTRPAPSDVGSKRRSHHAPRPGRGRRRGSMGGGIDWMVQKYSELVEQLEQDDFCCDGWCGDYVSMRDTIARTLDELTRRDRHRLLRAVLPIDRRVTAATYLIERRTRRRGSGWWHRRASVRWRDGLPDTKLAVDPVLTDR